MTPDLLSERKNLKALLQEAQIDGADALVIIGSHARRKRLDSISDIDILRIGDLYPQYKPSGMHVMNLSKEELVDRVREGDDFAQWALRYGAVLHGRRFWERLRQELLPTAPWPKPERPLRQARKTSSRLRELLKMGDLEAATEYARLSLSQLARAVLLSQRVFPLSRPELPSQLHEIDESQLAELLQMTFTTLPLPYEDTASILDVLERRIPRLERATPAASADN